MSRDEGDRPRERSTLLTLTWIALVGLTLGSYGLYESEAGSGLLLAISLVKMVLIAGIFMELRGCRPLFLRAAALLGALTLGIIVSTL